MIKVLARWILKVLALLTPVVIAACYGPPADYRNDKLQCGSVRDAVTQTGIAGIEVTCLQNGGEIGMAYTESNGYFCVTYDAAVDCKVVNAKDVDGNENGGTYLSAQMDAPKDHSDVTLDLTK